ncbi:MAG: hypothetical protein P8I27_00930 [Pirellulaceae bacterium]|nr:hypothetical protein [Pirellulaceae bacterium]
MKTNQTIGQAIVTVTLASLFLLQGVAVGQSRSSKSSRVAPQKSAARQTASRQTGRSQAIQARSSLATRARSNSAQQRQTKNTKSSSANRASAVKQRQTRTSSGRNGSVPQPSTRNLRSSSTTRARAAEQSRKWIKRSAPATRGGSTQASSVHNGSARNQITRTPSIMIKTPHSAANRGRVSSAGGVKSVAEASTLIKRTPESKKKGLSLPPTSNPDDPSGTATTQFFPTPSLGDVEDTIIDLGNKAGDAISDAGETVSDLVEEGSNLLGDVADQTTTEVGETVYRLRDGATSMIDKTKDRIRETGNEVKGQVDELETGARETFAHLREDGNDQIDRWQDNTNDVIDRFQEDQLGHRRGNADAGEVNDTADEGGFNVPHIPADRAVDTANQGFPMIEADFLIDHPLIGEGNDPGGMVAENGFDLPFIEADILVDDTVIEVPPTLPTVEDDYHDGNCYDDFLNTWQFFFPIVCQPRPAVIAQETGVAAPPVDTVLDAAPAVDLQNDLANSEEILQVPVGATLELVGQDLGAEMGEVHLNIGPISLKAEVIEWDEMVVVTLPNFVLAEPTLAQLVMVRADGQVDTMVDVELIAAENTDQ